MAFWWRDSSQRARARARAARAASVRSCAERAGRTLGELGADQRGAAFVETLIAFPVIFLSFFALYQLSFVYAADLIMERAASAAARAAVVFLAPHELVPSDGGAPAQAYVTEAARRVLLASPAIDSSTVKVSASGEHSGFAMVTVKVEASMACRGLSLLCGLDGKVGLSSEASLPIQSDIAIGH